MPNLKQYGYGEIMALFDEAVRTIPGYDRYNPDKEVKALIDYENTKDNYAMQDVVQTVNCIDILSAFLLSLSIENFLTCKAGKEPISRL